MAASAIGLTTVVEGSLAVFRRAVGIGGAKSIAQPFGEVELGGHRQRRASCPDLASVLLVGACFGSQRDTYGANPSCLKCLLETSYRGLTSQMSFVHYAGFVVYLLTSAGWLTA